MRSPLALLLLALPALASAQDWAPIDLNTSADILFVQGSAAPQPWAVGSGGFAAKSDLTRLIWTPENVGTSADLFSLLEPASSQVWVGGGNGQVRRLILGNWESRNLPQPNVDFRLFTRGSGTAGAVGMDGSIYLTEDGGDTWDLRYNAGVPLRDARGFVTSRHWAVGDGGTIVLTTDGGDNYTVQASGTTADLYGCHEAAVNYAVGAQGTILVSGDGGLTWSPRNSGTAQTLRAVTTSPQNSSWVLVVGDAGTVLKSTDGGQNWCRLFPETTADLYAGAMLTNNEYLVAGANGVMLRTTNGGGDCISVAADLLPREELELDLYPNPLPATGRVEFAAARAGDYVLEVYDVAGRRIAGLAQGRLAARQRQSLALDTQGWSAGVYFLRLSQGDSRLARRFTVLR